MKLYLGSRDYKPEGYKTVDIDPTMKPDIVADITKMNVVGSDTCEEVVAGHVLEHIDWPDSFLAFSEFARVLQKGGVLKVAIPDLGALIRMMLAGDSAFHVVGLVYGVGGRINRFEQHRYGFTIGMIVDILETLGFGEFDWWNSDFGDASNGWCPRNDDAHVGISLNVKAVKLREPLVQPERVYMELVKQPLSDFLTVIAQIVEADGPTLRGTEAYKIYQRIHFKLIEANQRIKYLEGKL